MLSQLKAATARAVITPPVGITHANWGAQIHTRAEGIDLDLWATALVAASGKTQVAIVDLDLLDCPMFLVTATREAITRLTGIQANHIRISASHTHSAGNLWPAWFPDGKEMIPAYVNSLPERIAGAVWEAQRNLRRARIAAGLGHSQVAVNRRLWHPEQKRIILGRNWDGFADHEMVVARIDDEQEQPIATLVNYSCHPTIMAYRNSLITPDYPGVLRRTVEDIVGGKCLFLQGAAGNVHPKESFSSQSSDYHRVGRLLGLEASKVALGLDTLPRTGKLLEVLESGAELGIYADEADSEPDGTLLVATKTIELPLIDLPSIEEVTADYERKSADLTEARLKGDEKEIQRCSMLAKRIGMKLGHTRNYQGRKTADIELQVMRIGCLALVCIQGEPFAEIGAEIRHQSPFQNTIFSGYSNGIFAYIPMEYDYEQGGYGVWNSPVTHGAAEKVIDESLALLRKIL